MNRWQYVLYALAVVCVSTWVNVSGSQWHGGSGGGTRGWGTGTWSGGGHK